MAFLFDTKFRGSKQGVIVASHLPPHPVGGLFFYSLRGERGRKMEPTIWHLTKDGAVTLCGLDRDKTQDMINVIYAGHKPDEGEWCKECHFQNTGLIWEKDENIPCVSMSGVFYSARKSRSS